MRRIPKILLLVLMYSVLSAAQNTSGGISGTVTDEQGAVISHAEVVVRNTATNWRREVDANEVGRFRIDNLQPGTYQISISASGFTTREAMVAVRLGEIASLSATPLKVHGGTYTEEAVCNNCPDVATNTINNAIGRRQIEDIPLAQRSFANLAYIAPGTAPVEPSDPTKARITAVSFAGSSGLNVDLSVDGGDNNDDYIGGFLQNYSPEAIQEFNVRTAQFDADASRTNGGSVIIATRSGSDTLHGGAGYFYRGNRLNARNHLDNPEPNPKQPFSRQNVVANLGGPIVKDKLFFFTSFEYVDENASVAYSANNLNEFNALAQLAASGQIPGVTSIAVPSSVTVPFRDLLFDARLDWQQSSRSQWFLRFALDRNHTQNDLIQQGTLPSTGVFTRSNYHSVLASNQFVFNPAWLGTLTLQASFFDHTKSRNQLLHQSLQFPLSKTFLTTSGLDTFGDNQFATAITAFPVERDQQKYQLRYDLAHSSGSHSTKFGLNLIHEPVLRGAFAGDAERVVSFPEDPSFYLANPGSFAADYAAGAQDIPAANGTFAQSIRRLGVYAQDSWKLKQHFTLNYGLRYDTTFGLFRASGRDQNQNPAVAALRSLNIPFGSRVPHDYRGALSPRIGISYSPGSTGSTVIRAGFGLFYNDLAQNGWAEAFQAVNAPFMSPLAAGAQGFVIDPDYHTPYALQASFALEQRMGREWRFTAQYQHHQGVHQYRRYEYVSGITLPASAPSVSLFRTDNRSQYDGLSFLAEHRGGRYNLTAHYTLAKATTYGAVVGELFDYVNGVSDVRNPFGPGDHGPSGEDIRHRFVVSGTLELPYHFQLATLAQFESARPFTLTTPEDLNGDGVDSNDRAVVNGVQTALDQFRGVPFSQIDLRVSREFRLGERFSVRPFAEFFNLLNRSNPGNNFVTDIAALPTRVNNLSNATAFCLDATCTSTRPIRSIEDLRVPGGALGDFFGLGTTVGGAFAAQLGIRVSF